MNKTPAAPAAQQGGREGSLEAPTRHPLAWRTEAFYDPQALEKEPRIGAGTARLQAESFARPCARRRARTLRPPLVAMRERKPWRRLRTILLG